jgi:eukaryotic-like serine/threonine-protein kinase
LPPLTQHKIELPERYRVVRHVANGGMASVWAAQDELLGRQIAVKVLAPAYAQEEAARHRFMREARAAARVSDHANVVTIYDVGEHEGVAFIVMELLTGGTVNDRIKRGEPIPHAMSLHWLEQVAAALDAAHKVEIVHRDVKPANLLLDEHDRLAVGDFGIATLASETPLTMTGQVLGTAAYLSPEQALGRAATPASDRYALAVVAFELLTGRRPFMAEHAAAQARQHVEAAPPAASETAGNLPLAVDAVLERGMAKDPAERPPTACALVEDLERALGEQATAAITPITAPTRRFVRRSAPPLGVAIPDPDRPLTPRPEHAPPPVHTNRIAADSGGASGPRRPAGPTGFDGAPPARPGRGRRFAPVVALIAFALVLGAVIAAATSGGGGTTDRAASRPPAKRPGAGHKSKAKVTPPASTQTQTAATQTTPAQPVSAGPAQLQSQGHQALVTGSYTQAIQLLQQATHNCPVQQTDPCAYALFDLGHALRLAGRPQAAIPVLQQRLQNSDQRGTVVQELAAAMQQAGMSPARGGHHGDKHGGGKGRGKRGGD